MRLIVNDPQATTIPVKLTLKDGSGAEASVSRSLHRDNPISTRTVGKCVLMNSTGAALALLLLASKQPDTQALNRGTITTVWLSVADTEPVAISGSQLREHLLDPDLKDMGSLGTLKGDRKTRMEMTKKAEQRYPGLFARVAAPEPRPCDPDHPALRAITTDCSRANSVYAVEAG